MNDVLKQIGEIGILPVVVITDVKKAVPLAHALIEGGINCMEITLRTNCAMDCIKEIKANVPDMLIGAGTVLSVKQAYSAMQEGARFLVAPGLNPNVVWYCVQNAITIIPGCATPSETEAALGFGFDVVKFFPAQAMGGVEYIKAVSSVYDNIKFIPTGGINADNIKSYLSLEKVLAVGASYIVKKELIDKGDFSEITRLCKEAIIV